MKGTNSIKETVGMTPNNKTPLVLRGGPAWDWLLRWSTLGWLPVLVGILALGYLGGSFSDWLSFRVDDGWCPDGSPVFGSHCWGDFGFPYARGGFNEVYVTDNMAAANSPLTNLVFEVLTFAPYSLGLALVLVGIIVSVIGAIWISTRSLSKSGSATALLVMGLGTLGAISSLDRANWIGLFPLPLVLYVLAMKRGKWFLAGALVGLLIALKPWAVILLLPMIARRKFRSFWLAFMTGMLLYVLPLTLFPGSLGNKMSLTVEALLNRDYGAEIIKFSISIPSFLTRIACLSDSSCDALSIDAKWNGSPFLTYITIGLLIGWAFWMLKRYSGDLFLSMAPTLSLIFLAVPEAAPYNAIAGVAIGSLFLWQTNQPDGNKLVGKAPRSYFALGVALILTNLPSPLLFLDAGITVFGYGRLASILLPLAWLVAILVTILESDRTRDVTIASALQMRVKSIFLDKCKVLYLTSGVFVVAMVFLSLILSLPEEVNSRTTRLNGGETLTVVSSAGLGTGRGIVVRPKNYALQGPDMALYFADGRQEGSSACPLVEVFFGWEAVVVQIPDLGFAHRFILYGIDDAKLSLSEEGNVITWSTSSASEEVALNEPVCLDLNGAFLAAPALYAVDLTTTSGFANPPSLSTFSASKLAPLASALVLILLIVIYCRIRSRRNSLGYENEQVDKST